MRRALFLLLILAGAAFAQADIEQVYGKYQGGIERTVDRNYRFLRYALPVEGEVRVDEMKYVFVVHMDGRTEFGPGESRNPDFIMELTQEIVDDAEDDDKLHAHLPEIGFEAESFKGRIIKTGLERKLGVKFRRIGGEEKTGIFERIRDFFNR